MAINANLGLSGGDISIAGTPAVQATELIGRASEQAFAEGFKTAQQIKDIPVQAKERANRIGAIDAEVAARPKAAALKAAQDEQALIIARQHPIVKALEDQLRKKNVSVSGLYYEDGSLPPIPEIQRRFDAEMERVFDRETAEAELDLATKEMKGILSNSTLTPRDRADLSLQAEKRVAEATKKVNSLRGSVAYSRKRELAAASTGKTEDDLPVLPAPEKVIGDTPSPAIDVAAPAPEYLSTDSPPAELAVVPAGTAPASPFVGSVTPRAAPVAPPVSVVVAPTAAPAAPQTVPVEPVFSRPYPNPTSQSEVLANSAAEAEHAAAVKAKQEADKASSEQARAAAELAANKAKANADLEKKYYANEETIRKHTVLRDDISKAIELVKPGLTGTTGPGSLARFVFASGDANRLHQRLLSIRASVGFNTLQEMRKNSPTGGALGQVSNEENKLLQSVEGSLSQWQSPEDLKGNLERIQADVVKADALIHRMQEHYRAAAASGYVEPGAKAPLPPLSGSSPTVPMTPPTTGANAPGARMTSPNGQVWEQLPTGKWKVIN